MVLSATPPEVYPLATAKGESIPLAVARPKGNVHIALAKDSSLHVVLPEDLNLVTCFFDHEVDIWVSSPTIITNNTYTPGVMALIADVAYDLALPSDIWIVAHHAAVVGHLNVVERWAQLQSQTYEVS